MKPTILSTATLALLACLAPAGFGQRAEPVKSFDLHAFLGEWYEIARLPDKAEKHCDANAFLLYARADKALHFQQVRSCTIAGGSSQVGNDTGVQNKTGDGRLGITFLYFLHHPRLVLGQAGDGSWVLIGTPNHKQLWLLSRTAAMPAAAETEAKNQASAQGYNVGKMVQVTQNDTDLRKCSTRVLSAAPQ